MIIIAEPENNLDFIMRCAEYEHIGDKKLLEHAFLSIAIQTEINTQGIQNKFSGAYGKGKTDAARCVMKLVGEKYTIECQMSDKAVFYDDNIKDGMIILCDDKKLSPELESAIKRAASNFQRTNKYTIVNKWLMPEEKIMPSRIVWFLTGVNSSESDEMLSRCIDSAIDESESQDKRVSDFIKKKANHCHDKTTDIPEADLKRCHEIFDDIKQHYFNIVVPKSLTDQISITGRRDLKMFIDHVRGYTIFDYKSRQSLEFPTFVYLKSKKPKFDNDGNIKTTKSGSVVYETYEEKKEVVALIIESNQNDLNRAFELYGEKFKKTTDPTLTDTEKDVLKSIPYERYPGIDSLKLQELTKKSKQTISNILHGNKQRQTKGLLEKLDYIQFEERTISKEIEDSDRTRESVKRYVYWRTDEKPKEIEKDQARLTDDSYIKFKENVEKSKGETIK